MAKPWKRCTLNVQTNDYFWEFNHPFQFRSFFTDLPTKLTNVLEATKPIGSLSSQEKNGIGMYLKDLRLKSIEGMLRKRFARYFNYSSMSSKLKLIFPFETFT